MKFFSLVIGLLLAGTSLAQDAYPNKPIRLITPAAQGGTTDLLARIFGHRAAPRTCWRASSASGCPKSSGSRCWSTTARARQG
jgi:tripartite-type tricarboxylate transporter receptor subunit TctC